MSDTNSFRLPIELRPLTEQQLADLILWAGDCSDMRFRRAYSALRELQRRRAADAAPQAPIANLFVGEDGGVSAQLYSPGLPPGYHDLYCVPTNQCPPLADAARGMTEEDRDACNAGAALANDRAGTFKGHHDAQHWLSVAKRLRALAAQEPSQREGE